MALSSVATPTDVEGPAPGRRLDRYELLLRLASGGMATVFVGRALALEGFDRLVAIKCCRQDLVDDPEFAQMFLDEARLAARIHHPNVVPVFDVGSTDGLLYLVMEYIEGDRLSGLLSAARNTGVAIPVPIALRIGIDMLTGLSAAHESTDRDGSPLHVVHRDVSPQNVLVGADGVVRLTDFGIARAETRAAITRDGAMKGKIAYMAPEQLQGQSATQQSDIFAAGVVLWETLAARRLFNADNEMARMNQILFSPIAPPSSVSPGVPSDIDGIVMRALERDPARRWSHASQFVDALERAGVRAASTREVAAYVRDRLGETLQSRRDAIAEALRTSVARAGARVSDAPREPIASKSVDAPARVPVPSLRDDTLTAVQTSPWVRRSSRGAVRWTVAAVVLVLAGLLVGVAIRPRGPSPTNAAASAAQPARALSTSPPPLPSVAARSTEPASAASVDAGSAAQPTVSDRPAPSVHRSTPGRRTGPARPHGPHEFTPPLI